MDSGSRCSTACDAVAVGCRELTALLHQSLHVQVEQSRPNAPMAIRNIHLLARPVEVYPVIHSLLPRFYHLPLSHQLHQVIEELKVTAQGLRSHPAACKIFFLVCFTYQELTVKQLGRSPAITARGSKCGCRACTYCLQFAFPDHTQ